MDVDVDDLERELRRIPAIQAVRVVANETGELAEVHVLATTAKHAKQVVRDIQSVAQAGFGVDIDRRLVSVVQLDDGRVRQVGGPDQATTVEADLDAHDDLETEATDRILVEGVACAQDGYRCTIEVALRRNAERVVGTAEGSASTLGIPRLVAQATLAALRQVEPAAARVELDVAKVVTLGDREVATTSLVLLVPPYEEVIAGAVVVRAAGEQDAMARAVLDATNRRLKQLR
jgi:hypothetical protein